VSYTTAEGRTDILDQLARASDALGLALAFLGAAYELLDDRSSDELEQALFRPVQLAYGRAKRTGSEFAKRSGLPDHESAPASAGAPSQSAHTLVDRAVAAAQLADDEIASLQDSMLPVEVGDQELRAGLAEVRSLIGPVPVRARDLLRTLGR
jgi:hypothetical protein